MSKVIQFVGLPASGKSTYAKELARKENAVILSSDNLRLELYNNVNDQNHNTEIFQEMSRRMKQYLNNNQNVILDATNIAAKKRINFLQGIKDHAKEVYYFDIPFETCIERDKKRERTVGKRVIDRMYRQLQIPTYAEGWDSVHIVHDRKAVASHDVKDMFEDNISQSQTYEKLFNTLRCFEVFINIYELPHDSKWHSLSVSRHTYYVWDYIRKCYDGEDKLVMLWAALLHDVGKAYCKNFKDGSRYANYISHEFVGGQLSCKFLRQLGYDNDFILKVVELVQLHMRLLSIEDSTKAIEKLKQFVGDYVFRQLELLGEADTQAH